MKKIFKKWDIVIAEMNEKEFIFLQNILEFSGWIWNDDTDFVPKKPLTKKDILITK